MRLYIKNLKCVRCNLLVKEELKKLGINNSIIKEGSVEIKDKLSDDSLESLQKAIKEIGLEIIHDPDGILVEKIKALINELIDHSKDWPAVSFSEHITGRLGYSYKYLNRKFTANAGTSVKQYLMKRKADRVKELLAYEDLSISQIAFRMNYYSPAHLTNHFKSETGLTPSRFRMIKRRQKNPGVTSNL